MWTMCLHQRIKDVSLMNVISAIENDLVQRMILDVPARFMDLLIKWYHIKTVMLTWLHSGMFLAKQHSHSEIAIMLQANMLHLFKYSVVCCNLLHYSVLLIPNTNIFWNCVVCALVITISNRIWCLHLPTKLISILQWSYVKSVVKHSYFRQFFILATTYHESLNFPTDNS